MGNRKENRQYTFTVEGETERWYLEWLGGIVNQCPNSRYQVRIVAKVQQSPRTYAKGANSVTTPYVTHICDYESNEQEHVEKFQRILAELKEANAVKGRKLKYTLGYSNFTFELWMILHKRDCRGCISNRTQYLAYINQAYNQEFESLTTYKEEKNFKRCLSQLSLEDVQAAIRRAQRIMEEKEDVERAIEYKGFRYYKENPALTIWEPIAAILQECQLLE